MKGRLKGSTVDGIGFTWDSKYLQFYGSYLLIKGL